MKEFQLPSVIVSANWESELDCGRQDFRNVPCFADNVFSYTIQLLVHVTLFWFSKINCCLLLQITNATMAQELTTGGL